MNEKNIHYEGHEFRVDLDKIADIFDDMELAMELETLPLGRQAEIYKSFFPNWEEVADFCRTIDGKVRFTRLAKIIEALPKD